MTLMAVIPERVEKETEDRVILVDRAVNNIVGGLFMIGIGSFVSLSAIKHDCGLQNASTGFIILFGVSVLFSGLHAVLVRETIIIDKKLQSVVTMEKSHIKYFKSTKKISFSDIRIVEITYDTPCKNCDYDSPMTDSNGSWDISLITIDGGSVKIYHGDSKPEVEKIAESICKITGKMLTHRTEYTPIPGC